jgi:hypothetical protein
MLVRKTGAGAVVIGQASHAWVSGQLARAWGNERFPAPSPREEVCLAAEQHDVGWTEWDLRPTLNPDTGWPHAFLEMPELRTHIELWSRAPDRLLSQSAYAALLVSMHGTALYGRRDLDAMSPADAELVRDYMSRESRRQESLIAKLELDRSELARNQRLIWTWDSLSLAICLPWDPYTADRVRSADDNEVAIDMRSIGEGAFELDPWPFAAGELQVRCDGRHLDHPFTSETDLHAALAAAPVARLTFTLHPAGVGARP